MTSKWKTVRKTNLKRYAIFEFGIGALTGVAGASFAYGLILDLDGQLQMGIILLLSAVFHWWWKRDEHPRITKAIKDAGGESQR